MEKQLQRCLSKLDTELSHVPVIPLYSTYSTEWASNTYILILTEVESTQTVCLQISGKAMCGMHPDQGALTSWQKGMRHTPMLRNAQEIG